MTPKSTICLWFDGDAQEAARFYAATFPDSKVTAVTHRDRSPDGLGTAHGAKEIIVGIDVCKDRLEVYERAASGLTLSTTMRLRSRRGLTVCKAS